MRKTSGFLHPLLQIWALEGKRRRDMQVKARGGRQTNYRGGKHRSADDQGTQRGKNSVRHWSNIPDTLQIVLVVSIPPTRF